MNLRFPLLAIGPGEGHSARRLPSQISAPEFNQRLEAVNEDQGRADVARFKLAISEPKN